MTLMVQLTCVQPKAPNQKLIFQKVDLSLQIKFSSKIYTLDFV